MIKILILKNENLDIMSDFVEAKNFFSSKGIEVDFKYKNIKIPITLKEYKTVQGFDKFTGKPAQIKYLGVIDSVRDTCKQFVTSNKYDIVIMSWDIDTIHIADDSVATSWGGGTQILPNTEFVQLAVNKYDKTKDVVWKKITHEILHAICSSLNKKGKVVQDEMDNTIVDGKIIPFYLNDYPDSNDGNYAHTIRNIKPYLSEFNTPESQSVIITRLSDNGVQTTGELTYGDFKCKTLERPFLGNKPNISAIPKGSYSCVYTFSPRMLKYTYELQKTSPRSGIRIHSSSYWSDLQGCIGLGSGFSDLNKDGQIDIVNSRITIKKFEDLMARKPFTLIIK